MTKVANLIRHYVARGKKRRRRYAEGGDVTADDMIEQARRKLAGLPERAEATPAGVSEPVAERSIPGDVNAALPEAYADPKVGVGALLKNAVTGLATLPRRAIENSQRSVATGHYDPGPVLEAAMLPLGTGAIAGVPMRAGETVLGSGPIRAYHGSPYDFEKFDVTKIGAGEGHQAYGHGLYFAENPAVAKKYRDALSYKAERSANYSPNELVNDISARIGSKEPNVIYEQLRKDIENGLGTRYGQMYKEATEKLINPLEVSRALPGRGYEVNIHADPAKMLAWDKPLEKQGVWDKLPTNVRGAIDDAMDSRGLNPMGDVLEEYTGKDLYRALQHEDVHETLPAVIGRSDWYKGNTTEKKHVSEFLNSLDVPGIKYLDQGSRNAPTFGLGNLETQLKSAIARNDTEAISILQGEIASISKPTSNYVMFDDKLIDILKKYGVAGAAAPGLAAEIMKSGEQHLASGGRVGYADGGAPDLPDAPWASPAPKVDDALPDAPWASKPATSAPAAAATSWTDTAKEAGKGALRGTANFVGDMGQAVMGPFGPDHHAANLASSLGFGERPKPDPTYGQQIAKATGIEANPNPDTKGRYAGAIGEAVGNPASYFGPGGWLSKVLMGAASGAGGEAAGHAAEGTGYELPARVAGSMVAGPVAGRVIKPQLAAPQQTLADAGVRQTPGQLAGGIFKDAEDKMTSVPILGHFISNARGRSVEGFNRAVGDQALAPIGGRIPRRTEAGHDMVGEVEQQLSAAYDRVVPHLQFAPDRRFATDMLAIHQRISGQLPPAQVDQFNRIISTSFSRGGHMTGEKIKTIEEELGKIGRNYSSSPMPAERDLGYAVTDTLRALRSNLERVNPQHADDLRRINSGWAMFVRMRDAASRRATGDGVFMPSDLLAAVKRGDRSVGKGSFARGDALMQEFGEAGQAVLPSKIPDSGTAGRGLMHLAATGGLGYLNPKILAGVAGASAAYTRPSTWLLNHYVSPTTGARADYASAGRGAGMLRPAMTTPLDETPYGEQAGSPYQSP